MYNRPDVLIKTTDERDWHYELGRLVASSRNKSIVQQEFNHLKSRSKYFRMGFLDELSMEDNGETK